MSQDDTKPGYDDLVRINEQLQEQVAHLQQICAIGELTGTTAHEFNNILMVILNHAQMGLRYTDDATRTKSLSKILEAAQRASKITSTILALARNRKPGLEPTDLIALTEDVLLLLERELKRYRIAVERDFSPIPLIQANGNQLQQVLLNLLINARQAMLDGGRLVIRIGLNPENQVQLSIRDYGTGIPQDVLPKIFDSYFTTKSGPDESGKGGTGLGLSLCKKIIESHNGKIRVESAIGKGTCFTLRFPLGE